MAMTTHSAPLGASNTDTHTIQAADSIRDTRDLWDKAMAAYLAAKAEDEAYDNEVWRPAFDREAAFVQQYAGTDVAVLRSLRPDQFMPETVEAEGERRSDLQYDLHMAIFHIPAPDASALKWKLDYLLGDQEGNNWADAFIAQTKADIDHLLTPQSANASGDAKILDAFKRWQDAQAEGGRHGRVLPDDVAARLDAAEIEIRETLAVTPAGVAAKLWVALDQTASDPDFDELRIRAADVAYLEEPGQDWNYKLFGSALRSLEMMSAPCGDDPVATFWHAFDAYNANLITEDEYIAAVDTLDAWQPATAHDFLRKFEAMFSDGGAPTDEREDLLTAQAIALLGGPRTEREG